MLAGRRKGVSTFTGKSEEPGDPLIKTMGPFAFNRFAVCRNHSSCAVRSMGMSGCFSRLETSIMNTCCNFCFLRITGCCTERQGSRQRLLGLLCRAVHTLAGPRLPGRLVHCVFRLGILAVGKRKPRIFRYMRYNSQAEPTIFDTTGNKLIYGRYSKRIESKVFLSNSALCAVRCVRSDAVRGLCAFGIGPRILRGFKHIVKQLVGVCMSGRFGSLRVLRALL